MLDGWATEILVIVEAARWARDFPTNQQVEAAAKAMNALPGLNRARGHEAYMRDARAALEAVRDTMIGTNQ
jgi:hypothetical protein